MRGAVVLAGGRSSRFGSNKALVKLKGRPLIDYVIRAAVKAANELVVAISLDDDLSQYAPLLPESARVVKDPGKIQSPLIGMLAGMKVLASKRAVVLPCDSPFINVGVLNRLFEICEASDAAIPRWPNGYIEPLHSVYNVESAVPAIEASIEAGELKVAMMIRRLRKVAYVPVDALKKYDPKLLTFLNVNTEEEVKKAELIMHQFPDTPLSFPSLKLRN